MSRISIRSRAGEFIGDLDGSDISNAIWLSPPITLETNMLGGMMYCELPLDAVIPKEGRTVQLETGDIAYWPGPGAFCVFFGPTPLSGDDGKPVAPYPVIKIGKMIGDCSGMDAIGDRQRIVVSPLLGNRRGQTQAKEPCPALPRGASTSATLGPRRNG